MTNSVSSESNAQKVIAGVDTHKYGELYTNLDGLSILT